MRRFVAAALAAGSVLLGACGDDPEVGVGATGEVTDDVEIADGFDTLDANGDSYLDTDELAEWADDVGTFDEWDEDTDSELDPDEISGNVFELWDSDANGKISKDEWQDAAELWYPHGSDLIVYEDVDFDGDSEIDADEFAERFDWSVVGESWMSNSLDEETFKVAYFELYDANNDGKVTESEWASGSAVFGTPG